MLRALLSLLAVALLVLNPAYAGEVPKPVVKIENPGSCIAPAEEMRRNHMEKLLHQRNKTLREGMRGGAKSASLNGCIECHASKTTGVARSVLGSNESFCQGCHAYAAVKLDCFECHSPKAGYKAAGAKP
ncbi:MAG: hypothetical protein Q8O34_15795 [Rhodocyclaceae bacterium]|nr:hypothetical protein [Rhodocyclaceae bacterium]